MKFRLAGEVVVCFITILVVIAGIDYAFDEIANAVNSSAEVSRQHRVEEMAEAILLADKMRGE